MKKRPTHFFVYLGHSTQTKNNLQKDFGDYLKTLKGLLIVADQLDNLKKQIIAKANELNALHKRCTPLQISFSELYPKNGYMIGGYYFITFHILEAFFYEEYLSN